MIRIGAVTAYIGAIVAANWATSRYGFVPVGFGLMATAGTYFAGFALLLRDVVQDAAGRLAVFLAILAGAVLSYWLASPALAIASGIAFGVSELADFAVYTPLRERGWARAVLASNFVGALIDTYLFLFLAGFPITSRVVAGQLLGKGWATLVPVTAISALSRNCVKSEDSRGHA